MRQPHERQHQAEKQSADHGEHGDLDGDPGALEQERTQGIAEDGTHRGHLQRRSAGTVCNRDWMSFASISFLLTRIPFIYLIGQSSA